MFLKTLLEHNLVLETKGKIATFCLRSLVSHHKISVTLTLENGKVSVHFCVFYGTPSSLQFLPLVCFSLFFARFAPLRHFRIFYLSVFLTGSIHYPKFYYGK